MLQDHSLAHLCVTLKRTRLPGEALEPIINVGDYDDVGSKAQIALGMVRKTEAPGY